MKVFVKGKGQVDLDKNEFLASGGRTSKKFCKLSG